MFFYASLFFACMIAALVILWAYHVIADAGSAFLRTMLPSNKKGPASHLSVQTVPKTINGTPTPWGWRHHDTPANMAKTHAAMPTGEQLDGFIDTESEKLGKPGAGWVQRHEISGLGGKAYKVTRQISATESGREAVDRPWGW